MIKISKLVITSTILLLSQFGVQAQEEVVKADALKPYQATYKLFRKGSDLGEGFRELSKTEDGYKIKSMSKISWLFLSDSRNEVSNFNVLDGLLTAKDYRYVRTGTGRDREEIISFSPELIESTYKSNTKQIKPILYTYDPLLYQLALRQDLINNKKPLSYHLIRKGKETQYRFERKGLETVNTPYGRIEAIKIERIRGNGSPRKTLIWAAPSLNYVIVKMTQYKDGAEQADLQLSSLKL